MYRRGTYMGIVNNYGGLTGSTTFNYDPNLEYLGNDGATDVRLQYEYSSIFNQNYSICQISGYTTTTTTILIATSTTTIM